MVFMMTPSLLQVLTIMTVCGACVAGARVFIPDENLVFCPEKTLTQVRVGVVRDLIGVL